MIAKKTGEEYPLDPEAYVGKRALWTIVLHQRGIKVTVLVNILEARKQWNRVDLLIRTNSGDEVWVSNKTVRLVEDPLNRPRMA